MAGRSEKYRAHVWAYLGLEHLPCYGHGEALRGRMECAAARCDHIQRRCSKLGCLPCGYHVRHVFQSDLVQSGCVQVSSLNTFPAAVRACGCVIGQPGCSTAEDSDEREVHARQIMAQRTDCQSTPHLQIRALVNDWVQYRVPYLARTCFTNYPTPCVLHDCQVGHWEGTEHARVLCVCGLVQPGPFSMEYVQRNERSVHVRQRKCLY